MIDCKTKKHHSTIEKQRVNIVSESDNNGHIRGQ